MSSNNNAMSDEEYARRLQMQFDAEEAQQSAQKDNGGNVHNGQNNMQADKNGGILVGDFINICNKYETSSEVNDYLTQKMGTAVKNTKYSPWDVNFILEKVDIGKFKGINDLCNLARYLGEDLKSVPDNLSPKYIEFLFLESGGYDEEEDGSYTEEHKEFCELVCSFMVNYVKKISNDPNKPNMEFANDKIIKTFFFDSEGKRRKKSEVAKFLGTDDAIFKPVIDNKLDINFIIYLFQNNVGVGLEDDFLKNLMKKNGYQQKDIETIISKKNELWVNSLTCSDLLQKDSYINKLLDGKIKSDKINFTNEQKTRLQVIKNIVLDINKILVETKLNSVKDYENTIDSFLEFNLNIHGNEDETKNFIQRAKSVLDLLKKSELIDENAITIDEFLNHGNGNFAKMHSLAQSDFVKSYIVGIVCELSEVLNFSVQKSFLNVLKSFKENVFTDTDNEEKQCELKKLFIKALIAKFKDKEISSPWAKSFPIKDILEYKYGFDTEKSNEGEVFGQDSGLDQSDWEYFYCCCNEFGVDINKYWPNETNEKDVEYKNKYGNEMKLALEKNKKPANEIKDGNYQIKEYEKKLIIDLLTGKFDVPIEDVNPEINNNVQPPAEAKDNKEVKDKNGNNIRDNNSSSEVSKKDECNVNVQENPEEQMPEAANNNYGLPNDIFKDINDCVDKMAVNGSNLYDVFITDLNSVAFKVKDNDIRQKAKMCFIDIFFQNQKCIEKIAADDKELFVVKMMGELFNDHGLDSSNVDDYSNCNGMYNVLYNRGQGDGEDAKKILEQKKQLFAKIKEQLKENAKQKNDLFIDENDINYFETVWDKAVQKCNEQNKSEENVEQEDNIHERNDNQNIDNPEQDEKKPVKENNVQGLSYNIQNNIDNTVKNMKNLGNEDLPKTVIDSLNRIATQLGKVNGNLASEAKSYFMDKFFSDCIEKVSQFGDKSLFVVLMIDHKFSQLKVLTENTKSYLEAHKNLNELKKQPNEQNQEKLKNMEQDLSQKFEAVLEALEDAESGEQREEPTHINKTDIENFMIKWDKSVEEYNKKSPEDKKFANLFSDGMTDEELKTALAKMDNQNNISDDNNKANQLNKNNEEGEEDEVDALEGEAITMLMSEAYGLTVENIMTVNSEIDNLDDSGYLPISFLPKLINCNRISQNAIYYFIDGLFYWFGNLLETQYSGKIDEFKLDVATALSKLYPVKISAIVNYEQTTSEENIDGHLSQVAAQTLNDGRQWNPQTRENEKNNFISRARQNAARSIGWNDIKDRNGKVYVNGETVSYFEAKFSKLSKGKKNKYGEILQNEEAIDKKKGELRQKKIQEWENKIKQEYKPEEPEKKERPNPEEIIKQQLKILGKENINDDEFNRIINYKNNKSEVTNKEKEHTGTIKNNEQQIPFNQNPPSFLTDRKKFYEKPDNDNIDKKQNSVVQPQQPLNFNSEDNAVKTNPNPNKDSTNPEINNNLVEQKQKDNNNPAKQDDQTQIKSNSQMDEQKSKSEFKSYFIVSMIVLAILLALTFAAPLPSLGKVIFIVFDGVASGFSIYNGIQFLRLCFANNKPEPIQPVIDVKDDKNDNLDIDKVKDQISNGEQKNVPITGDDKGRQESEV